MNILIAVVAFAAGFLLASLFKVGGRETEEGEFCWLPDNWRSIAYQEKLKQYPGPNHIRLCGEPEKDLQARVNAMDREVEG